MQPYVQKIWNSSSEICHNEIQLERRAQTSQPCVLCHTMLLTVLVPQMGIPSAQYIASTSCSGHLATVWQQWQEKTRCISRGGKERNVLKQMPVWSREWSFRSHWLVLHAKAAQGSCSAALARSDGRLSADRHTRWHLARPSTATYASPQQSSVTSNEPSLETTTNK